MTKSGKYLINMRSHADKVMGHGVLSAGEEQIRLVRRGLTDRFEVTKNHLACADITHFHTVNLRYYFSLPVIKSHGKAVGYVHFLPETVEGSLKIPYLARKVFYWYLIRFYKSMDALVVVNPDFIEKLAAYGIERERVTYIPNFVDDTDFHPMSAEQKRTLRQNYGLDQEKFTVGCAGQLQKRKGVLEFAEIAASMPDLQFLWAGGFSFGKMTDGYQEISKLLAHHPKNLHFTGIVPRGAMNGIYNLGDVMFLPSYNELFPMTILEAMSCHVPVLLRDLDIYPDILFDFYLNESTQQGFIDCLDRLKSDSKYYESAVDASKRGHAFYSKEHVLSMWDEFYSSLVEPGLLSAHKRKKEQPI